jgi:hypothetical protein
MPVATVQPYTGILHEPSSVFEMYRKLSASESVQPDTSYSHSESPHALGLKLSAFGSQHIASSRRRPPIEKQVPAQRHATLKVASGSVAIQPAMLHEPSSMLYMGS